MAGAGVAEGLPDLPAPVRRVLGEFVATAREVLGNDLRAVVLYGSAAAESYARKRDGR